MTTTDTAPRSEADADAQAAPAAPKPGRDNRGLFAEGNAGGPGNPFARQVGKLRQALLDAVTPEDIADVVKALLTKAKAGDVPAARLLFSYALGKPAPVVEPDRLNADEVKLYQDEATPTDELTRLTTTPLLDNALPLIRLGRVVVTQAATLQAAKAVQANSRRVKKRQARKEEWKKARREMRAAGIDPDADNVFQMDPAIEAEVDALLARLKKDPELDANVEAMKMLAERRRRSANGEKSAEAPSANGHAEAEAPSPNGHETVEVPSPNGPETAQPVPMLTLADRLGRVWQSMNGQ